MEIEYAEAKSIITAIQPTKQYISRDYNMNIYRGCTHGCIYCDSRSLCYHLDRFDVVRPKKDALLIIEDELKRKRKKGVIATGAMSDPYNPLENELRLTRGALALILKYGFGVSITTKSPLVMRDADILGAIARDTAANVQITITALDSALSEKIEPAAPPPSARFDALAALSRAGVYTGVFIMPVLPYITDSEENILGIVSRAADCGAKNIVCMPGMTLRAGNREYYYEALDKRFPGLKAVYQSRYGDSYVCESERSKALYAAFSTACKRLGIHYKFRDINAALNGLMHRQATLFDL